jgi:hypothetical protein
VPPTSLRRVIALRAQLLPLAGDVQNAKCYILAMAQRPAPTRQVNIRVSKEVHAVLKAAVWVKQLRGMQALLAPVVETQAAQLRKDPSILNAMALAQDGESDAGSSEPGSAAELRVPQRSRQATSETRPRRGSTR